MESTLLTGDFVHIALIVIIFASGSAAGIRKRLTKIEKQLKEYRTPSHVAALMNHVTDQVEPENREDFREELQALLKQYVVTYDKKYAWE